MSNRREALKWAGLLAIAAPAAAIAGMQAQGMQAQGMQAQGMQAQGMQAQGMQAQGMQAQGMQAQGMQAQGIQMQGMQAQGMQAQGMQAQGMQAQGVSPMGTDLLAADFKGVSIDFVTLRGTTATSPREPHELTAVPGLSTGHGNYISVGGGSAVGHYAVAHLLDVEGKPAEDLDLYIAGEERDPVANLFHRPDEQDNQDELYVVYFFHRWSGEWMSLCPYNSLTESASAMAIPEDREHPNRFFFACTATGVASKCARNWGYRPWAHTLAWTYDGQRWVEERHRLEPYYEICKLAAMADYCQDQTSYTKNGTLVDLFDTRQIIWPNALENPWNAANDDSRWMFAQEYFVSTGKNGSKPTLHASALQRTRYRELSPAGDCGNFAFLDRLEHDVLEDARWADPAHEDPRVEVYSPTYCRHHEREPGAALPWDCSPCTKAVCRTMPQCCTSSPTSAGWSSFCVAEANNVCTDGTTPWPPGRVWPTDVPADSPIAGKYLLGPGGAVLRVAGATGPSSPATVEGWACDPEWPGAVVSVQIWDAPREKLGSHRLGEVRAEQALAAPLAREVSLACDGPGRDYARHGFSYTLPSSHHGNVFVYAIDEATADGPAAPPTLIRNGIVAVPSWNGSRYAAVTTGWLEPPADGTYLFDSPSQPSRLFVNGGKVFDWWDASSPGTKQGSVALLGGVRYHLRWDRFQNAPPPPGAAGLTWRGPGAGAAPAAIPSDLLYELAPLAGTGLRAVYYDHPDFSGTSAGRIDEVVDLGTQIVPPSPIVLPKGIPKTGYSAVWDGEVVPWFSEDYTFIVVGSGEATLTVAGQSLPAPAPPTPVASPPCAHDLCAIGDKLAPTTGTVPACHPCVDQVCAKDPYCCNGGYLSYYSSEPVWDAKCVAEVGALCANPKISCTTPIPNPVSPQRKLEPIRLQAGVHYPIRLTYKNVTGDDTLRLLWSSPRQHKDVVPRFALYPAGQGALRRGAGLDVTMVETKLKGGVRVLDKAVASGTTPDLGLGATPAQIVNPGAPVLAPPPVGAATAKPSPPSIVRPMFGEELRATAPEIEVHGLGGLTAGSVHLVVRDRPGDADASGPVLGEMVVAVGSDGHFDATVPTGGFGKRTLELSQRTWPGASCPSGAVCAESNLLEWPVTVSDGGSAAAAPVIFTPRDPTSSPSPSANVFTVRGKGTNGPVTVTDLGGAGAAVLASSVVARPGGVIAGTITLSSGETDPSRGWHKLLFAQGGVPSKPVFVGVGIKPPVVTFPRAGAAVDCSASAPDPRQVTFTGSVPYAAFGKLTIAEENGRGELAVVDGDVKVEPAPASGGSYPFRATVRLGFGRHLLHVFQAPEPAAGSSPRERQSLLRAFATLAATPTTRLAVDVPPPRIDVQPGASLVLTATGPTRKLHLEAEGCGPPAPEPAGCASAGCGACVRAAPVPREPKGCALPNADVILRIGPRLFTTRADDRGWWSLDADLFRGWNDAELTQVVDTGGGAGWIESCPSNRAAVGVVTLAAGPRLDLPGDMTVKAASPKGVEVRFDARAAESAVVACSPASGTIFPIGKTFVSCSAVDPRTGAVGLGRFAITVLGGAPVWHLPEKGITAEATGPNGAAVSFEATADDFEHGRLPVRCDPASGATFPLDKDTTVSCRVADPRIGGEPRTFVVRVRDTTPPKLCPLRDLRGPSGDPKGAALSFETCADDLVDGRIGVSCNHPSGSFFPMGKTRVSCGAFDRHGNRAPPAEFTVEVFKLNSDRVPSPLLR